MSNWSDLLYAVGIDISGELSPEEKEDITECVNGPMVPYRYTDLGVAIFTTDQLEIGKPENFGFDQPYHVVEVQQQYSTDYKYEQSMDKARPIHRYSRCERFKTVLNQICGQSGDIPDKVLAKLKINHNEKLRLSNRQRYILRKMTGRMNETCKRVEYENGLDIKHIPRDQIWDHLKAILKEAKLPKYYNRIPAILGMANYNKGECKIDYQTYNNILADFKKMHLIFPKVKGKFLRSYFPSMRYMAHRLMIKHGVTTDLKVTTMKTPNNIAEVDKIYDEMWKEINEEEEAELINFLGFY